MAYKTILVHVDQSPQAPARIALAARLASEHGAHLIGAAMTGLSRYIFHGGTVDLARSMLDAQRLALVDEAGSALTKFEEIAAGVGSLSLEKRLVEDDEAPGLAMQARYADLVVLGQDDPDTPVARIAPDLPSYVMLNSACPVLVTPFAGAPESLGQQVLVAWNDTLQASRAVAGALPLLQRARKVALATYNAKSEQELSGAEIARSLARHGVNVEVRREQTDYEVGYALLELAKDLDAGLLVMGGYGHARFREVLLGGVTQTMLSSMTLPILMAH